MLASLLWPVTAFICRVSTFFEDKMVNAVALREWLVKYSWIPGLCDMREIKGPLKYLLMPLLGKNQLALTLHMYASIGPNLDNTHRGQI